MRFGGDESKDGSDGKNSHKRWNSIERKRKDGKFVVVEEETIGGSGDYIVFPSSREGHGMPGQ